MGQTFHKFKAETFDAAYQQMLRTLGKDAVVISTTEVKEGGLLGLLGHTLVELTAAQSDVSAGGVARRPSLPEKKYLTCGAAVGSEETVNETVAFFRQLVNDTRTRAKPQAKPESPSILPFRRKVVPPPSVEDLHRDMQEMRQLLRMLVAESPCSGLPPEFVSHYRALVDQGVARKLAAALVGAVVKNGDHGVLRNPRVFTERLRLEIQKRVAVTHGIKLKRGMRRTIAFVGPTGVGKTTNLAKLAALLAVRDRARVACVTMDTYRIAAPEQLRAYADIIGLPMRFTNDTTELLRALQAFRGYDCVLMDTAGGSQFNLDQIREMKSVFEVVPPDEVMLVLGANTQLEELQSAVSSFRCLKPTSLLCSKLDETRRYGALFTIAAEAGLPLSYFSTGQNVPDDIDLATPSKVAKLVLNHGGNRSGSGA